ncbi:hypothetical protein Tco_1550918, partial [Tanacetum coccineum]
ASNLNLMAYVNSAPSGFVSIRPASEPSTQDEPSVNNVHGSVVPADSSSSIPADNVPAGSSSSIPADYVSAGHVLVSADRDRIC